MIIYYHCTRDSALLLSFLLTRMNPCSSNGRAVNYHLLSMHVYVYTTVENQDTILGWFKVS